MNTYILKSLRGNKKLEVWSYVGALSVVEQIGLGYQVCERISLNELEKCDLLICPQSLSVSPSEVEDLVRYVEEGGIVIVSGIFALESMTKEDDIDEVLDKTLGLSVLNESDTVKLREPYLSGLVTPNFKCEMVVERYIFEHIYPKLPIFGYFKLRVKDAGDVLNVGRVIMRGTKENPSKLVEGPLMNIIELGDGILVRINPPIFGTVGLLLHRFTLGELPGFSEVCLLPHAPGDILWNELVSNNLAEIPVVDEYRLLIENLITLLALKTNKTFVKKFHLPPINENKSPAFLCLLTHDVDALYYDKEEWMCFEEWMRIESKYSAKSAFYFLATLSDVEYPMPCKNYSIECEVVRKAVKHLKEYGWEIGLHSAAYWDLNLMKREKELLERILNSRVVGTRQHFLMISHDTLKNRAKLGYLYDTSIYKEWRKQTFLTGTTLPYMLYDVMTERWLKLVELSSVLEDGVIFGFYDSNKRDYEDAYIEALRFLEPVLKHKGIVVLNWHQRTCKHMSPLENWSTVYDWILNYIVEKGGVFVLPKFLASWWKLRNELRLHVTEGERTSIVLENPTSKTLQLTLVIRMNPYRRVKEVLLDGCKLPYEVARKKWYLEICAHLCVRGLSSRTLLVNC